MEYMILGLLMLTPMTGYELQQFIKQNLSLICSHSAGSVLTALAKLEQAGRVHGQETSAGRRRKRVFSVTESGRAAFADWVRQPMQADRVKNMELGRLFFLGLARPAQRAEAIRGYLRQMEEMEATLQLIRARFDAVCQGELPDGKDWASIFRFQGYTIDYGIAAARFEREWYTRLLSELEEQQ